MSSGVNRRGNEASGFRFLDNSAANETNEGRGTSDDLTIVLKIEQDLRSIYVLS